MLRIPKNIDDFTEDEWKRFVDQKQAVETVIERVQKRFLTGKYDDCLLRFVPPIGTQPVYQVFRGQILWDDVMGTLLTHLFTHDISVIISGTMVADYWFWPKKGVIGYVQGG